jgi:UDP-GlcNAc:undecaprenyl-phosphate/decaprenyl-phosphate GlcNAc-1-phosphate transferase
LLTFIAIFLVALAASAVSTAQIQRIALSLGFVDQPDDRKTQERPMPLLGGLAIVAAVLLAILLASFIYYGRLPRSIAGVLLASGIVAGMGLVDDRFPLPPWLKLAVELLAVVVLIQFGIHIQLPLPDLANYLLTFLWVAGISNAINFLDNMDGLSAGVSAIAASFVLLLAAVNDQFLVASVSAAVLGACLGFLRYNFYPATIYMGDAGSLFLGFLLAVLAIQLRFPDNSNIVTWMVPVFILGLPIFDMVLVVTSRLRRGVSPSRAGHDHVSHRLVRRGFSQREAVLLLYLVSGILGMAAVFIMQATIVEGCLIGLATVLLALIAVWRLDRRQDSY